ncbi:hypothetical protein [Clostridium coskatii]|uniref:Uncharacterized protein n=1 Tax=Clostridium coskatii TaxID=1705578 RepID=A0A166TTC7_9CLOT|nr:hypothetical protein [Clostridium coskatii]OAA94067.1 hypothetical protein WX73_03637 [Clostridium coskatii]OBR96629.1 hypothetical protein CLCOS_07910 [Clostridium coskatii]
MDINIITSLVSVMVGGAIGCISPKIKFNKNIEGNINTGLAEADNLISTAKLIAPNSKAVNVIDFIEKRAEKEVQNVEQLAHTGDLQSNEEKFKTAQDGVYNSLELIGIKSDDKWRKVIDDSIQSAVNQLGHKAVPEIEKDKKINELQQQLQVVQARNNQLQQTIAQINASTAQTVIQTQPVQTV